MAATRLSSTHHVTAFAAGTPMAYTAAPGDDVLIEADSGKFNPATGPIELVGLTAGQWYAIRIKQIDPVGVGHVGPTHYEYRDERCWFPDGRSVPLNPNIGVLGAMPATGETKNDSCGPHGGNWDCCDHGPGAVAMFKAQCDGGGLAFGDVHWAMGDGEVEGQGIEGAAELHLSLHLLQKQVRGEWPWLIRDGQIMALGADEDFRHAVHLAYEQLIAVVEDLAGLERRAIQDAIGPAGHVRICQCCCRQTTVRCTVPLALVGLDEPTLLADLLAR